MTVPRGSRECHDAGWTSSEGGRRRALPHSGAADLPARGCRPGDLLRGARQAARDERRPPTVIAIYGDKLAPGLGDYYLGSQGYQSQQTDEPIDPHRPDNLWAPDPRGGDARRDRRAGPAALQARLPDAGPQRVRAHRPADGRERTCIRIEANPNPQLAYGEDFGESAELAGVTYEDLLQQILLAGLRWRPERLG